MPKISVIMNCLNGERYVREAIESVYAQSFSDWEIVFWDNASSDGTAAIARSFDSRLRYFRSARTVPLGEARKRAMAEARGEWIGFHDHDDVCLPHRFARQMAAVEGGDWAMCYAGIREIDGADRFVREVLPRHRSGDIFADLLTHFDANLQTTMVNAAYLKRYTIEIDSSFTMFEDYNLFMKLAAKGAICVVPEVLSVCRVLATSQTARSLECHAAERFATLEQLCRDNPGIDARHPRAFSEARARGLYYQGRWEMQAGRFGDARATLRSIRRYDHLYFALYLMSFWPLLWRIAHGRTTKSRLTALALKIRSTRYSRVV